MLVFVMCSSIFSESQLVNDGENGRKNELGQGLGAKFSKISSQNMHKMI